METLKEFIKSADELVKLLGYDSIAVFLVALGVLGAGLWKYWEKIIGLFKRQEKTHPNQIDIPKKTLTLIEEKLTNQTWWHMGSSGEKPAMQIVTQFKATNITNLDILVTQARMKKPKCYGHVLTRHPDQNMYGSYMIPARKISEVSLDFWVMPPIKKKGESFKADIGVVDQFGNEHWVKGIEFKYQ